jgi:hypothetical protein
MKRLLLVVVLVFVGAAVAGDDEGGAENLAAIEQMTWEAWANNDAAAYGKFLAEGTIGIGLTGITIGKDENIAPVAAGSCDVNSYELGEITAHKVAEGVVILTYEATQDATCDGVRVPEHVYSSSVWVEKDGEWYIAMYHETAVAE